MPARNRAKTSRQSPNFPCIHRTKKSNRSMSRRRCHAPSSTTPCPSSFPAPCPMRATDSSPPNAASSTRCTTCGSFRGANRSSARKFAVTRAATTTRTAKRSFIPPSSTWRKAGPCAKPWSTAKAISARSKAIRRPPCVTPRRGSPTSARPSWPTWTNRPSTSSQITTNA